MTEYARKQLYRIIIFISVIGLITASHLFNLHLNGSAGAICDINEIISCSIVSGSKYSELFNVPVAIFGIIWFIILILMSWRALKNEKAYHIGILLWNIIGLFSVFYLVWAEFMLKAICLYCTIVHIIVIICLILSIILVKTGEKLKYKYIIKCGTPWLIFILFLNSLPFVYYNINFGSDYDNFAKCLTENGMKLYSSFSCPVCIKQKNYFGRSEQFLNHVECHPNGQNSQTKLCVEKNIEATPTWTLEKEGKEIKRLVGFQNYAALAEMSGCK